MVNAHNHKGEPVRADDGAPAAPAPKLTVWFGAMPESNGKANWTTILHRGDMVEGFTIRRSEHHDRVRYDADRVRWLIGDLDKEPFILDYDGNMLWPEGWTHPCSRACGSFECRAGQRDGVLCADGECRDANGAQAPDDKTTGDRNA